MNEQNQNVQPPQVPQPEPISQASKKNGASVLIGIASLIVIIATLAILYSQQNVTPEKVIDNAVTEMDNDAKGLNPDSFSDKELGAEETTTTLPEPDASASVDSQIQSFDSLDINWNDSTLDDSALNDLSN